MRTLAVVLQALLPPDNRLWKAVETSIWEQYCNVTIQYLDVLHCAGDTHSGLWVFVLLFLGGGGAILSFFSAELNNGLIGWEVLNTGT